LDDNQHFRGDLRPASLQDWLAVHLAVRLARLDRFDWVKEMRQAVVSRVARDQSAIRFATPYGFDLLLPSADQGTLIMALGKARLHPRVREILEASIRPGDIVVDGGSNVGFFSLLAGRLLDGRGQVISFEPDPSTFCLLRQNVQYNNLESIVRLEQKALTNSDGSFEFSVLPHEPMRSSLFANPGPTGKTILVSGVCLDDYIEAHALQRVDIVKLDLEGAEPFALAGMAKSLLTARLVVFEINGPLLNQLGIKPLELVRRIAEQGSFKQISFVDEQENRAYAWNPEHFLAVLRDREIIDILCTKNEIHLPSVNDASSCSGEVVRSA
jgi:FkbM family methyltransferase